MVLMVLVAALAGATPAEPLPPLKLATGNFTFVGISTELKSFVPEHLAQALRRPEIRVVTSSEIASLIGLERQRQLLGCGDEEGASCAAELAGALGVDGIVMGELARVGDVMQLNLKIVSGTTGQSMGAYSTRVNSDNHLLDALDRAADSLADALLISTGLKAAPVASVAKVRRYAWVPAIAGVVFLAGGGVMLGFSNADHNRLTTRPTTPLAPTEGVVLARQGSLLQSLGAVSIGIGAAAVAAGAGLWLFGSAGAPVKATVVASPAGVMLGLGGELP